MKGVHSLGLITVHQPVDEVHGADCIGRVALPNLVAIKVIGCHPISMIRLSPDFHDSHCGLSRRTSSRSLRTARGPGDDHANTAEDRSRTWSLA
jgi:hypothetical protein